MDISPNALVDLHANHDLIVAVGDIHGRADCLEVLQEVLAAEARARGAQRPLVVYLGDYCDRGMQTGRVLDLLTGANMPGWRSIALRGNHDAWWLDAVNPDIAIAERRKAFEEWMYVSGSLATVRGYLTKEDIAAVVNEGGPDALLDRFCAVIPDDHLAFLRNLYDRFETSDAHFVHAGFAPGRPVGHNDNEILHWIREPFLETDFDWGKTVFHGHTPSSRGPIVRTNRVCCDTMCFRSGMLTGVIVGATGPHRYLVGTPPATRWGIANTRPPRKTLGSNWANHLDWSLAGARSAGAQSLELFLHAERVAAAEDALRRHNIPEARIFVGDDAVREAALRVEAAEQDGGATRMTVANRRTAAELQVAVSVLS